MNQNMNEDVAFERLKDLQREMENSRLTAADISDLGHRIRTWAGRAAKSLAASARQPARRPDHLPRQAPRG
jgi:uncharacterized protein (UPF0303 family)